MLHSVKRHGLPGPEAPCLSVPVTGEVIYLFCREHDLNPGAENCDHCPVYKALKEAHDARSTPEAHGAQAP